MEDLEVQKVFVGTGLAVHVEAAIFIWEYVKKNVIEKGLWWLVFVYFVNDIEEKYILFFFLKIFIFSMRIWWFMIVPV